MKVTTEHLKFVDAYPDLAKKYAQKLHIKKDDIPFVRKFYTSETYEPKDEKEAKKLKEERAIISYITTNMRDRDGEVLLPEGMRVDNYQKSGKPVFWGHKYSEPTNVIGQNMWLKKDPEGTGIIAKTAFRNNQFADEVYNLYTEEIVKGQGAPLKAWSVGFLPIEWEDGDGKKTPKRTYREWEILEYSAVPIGSNPGAISLAYQKGMITSEQLKKDFEIEITDIPDESEVKDFQEEIEIIEDTEQAKTMTPDQLKDYYAGQEVIVITDDEVDASEEDVLPDSESEEKSEAIVTGKITPLDKSEEVIPLDENTKEIKMEVVQKPETTEQYHRIPIDSPGNHKEHKIRTITVSASKGIKALYCVNCKKIITYLFSTDKWTMETARQWVNDHKKRLGRYERALTEHVPSYKECWNKSLSKLFDVAEASSEARLPFNFDLYEKFLECKVKDIFKNAYMIPCPLLGSYLAGFKEILNEFELKDTRNFRWGDGEVPPEYEIVQLNSEKSDDFLIQGVNFYEAEKKPLVIQYSPSWEGLEVSLITSKENREWNKELLDRVHGWVHENNLLKGESFALSGDFLQEPKEEWDSLVLEQGQKDSILKSISQLNKKGVSMPGRGLLFIGPPGTGKTKAGRVMMTSQGSTFIWVSSRDFRVIGPLRALALGFSLARDLAPSILFMEDVDNWMTKDWAFVTDLVKTEMDGIKQNRGTLTILTSNYPEKLPDALLDRPGRFHHIVNFELPDDEQRKEMLENWAGEIDEKLLNEIVKKTCGFSGAHIKELVEFAKIIAEEDEIEIGKALTVSLEKLVEQRELIEKIRENKKGLETSLRELFGMKKKKLDIEEKETSEEEATILDGGGEEQELGIIEEVEEKAGEENLVPEETAFCECVKCGAKIPAEEVGCSKMKCPKCGGNMRTAKKESEEVEEEKEFKAEKLTAELKIMDMDVFKEWSRKIESQMVEIKEGRILSTKNRTLVKDIIDNIATLKEKLENLYNATEPTPRTEDEKVVEEVIEIEEASEPMKGATSGATGEITEENPKEEKEVDNKVMAEIIVAALKKGLDPKFVASLTKEAVRDEFDRLRGIVKVEEKK